ncbi:MAG: UvrD-helicase domain-containing protein, partial [Patescibacteria group bacterium]
MYDLNSEQLAAVRHAGSPLLIIAGAGTGKTTVITQKIGWLIEQGLAKSDEILALTFTEKAAGEMAERVDMLLPYGYVDLWIMTFHSFAEKILRQHGLDIGLPTDFKLLNEFKQWALIKKNLDKFNLDYYRPLGNPTKFISALLQHFSRAKDEDINPAQYLEYAQELKQNLDTMLSGGGKRKNVKLQMSNVKSLPCRQAGMSNIQYLISNFINTDGELDKVIAEQEVKRINEVA